MPEDAENKVALIPIPLASTVSILVSFQSEEDDRVEIDNNDFVEDEADDIYEEETSGGKKLR